MSIPTLVIELTSFINRMPPKDCWKRLRIAVTAEELEIIKAYYFVETKDHPDGPYAVHALRGIPLTIIETP